MLKVELNDIAKEVYKTDLEKYLDWDSYFFDSLPIEVSEDDKERFVEFVKVIDPNIEILKDEIESLTRHAMFMKYEVSYMSDMYNRMKEELIKRTLEDFTDLNENVIYDDIQFDLYNDEVTIEEQLAVIEKDFSVEYDENEDVFIFEGSMEKLAYGVLSAIHGAGMFHFSSLQEFSDQAEGEDIDIDLLKESIKKHLFWLREYNKVYGNGMFSFNPESYSEHIDRYGTLGHFNFGREEVEIVIDELTISGIA